MRSPQIARARLLKQAIERTKREVDDPMQFWTPSAKRYLTKQYPNPRYLLEQQAIARLNTLRGLK